MTSYELVDVKQPKAFARSEISQKQNDGFGISTNQLRHYLVVFEKTKKFKFYDS